MPVRRRILATAIACICLSPPARASFPNCQQPLATPNRPIDPDAHGQYAPDPALPYAGPHTVWRTNGLAIKRTLSGATETPFIVRGVNYEPTQIGGSASISPYNDLFYTTDTKLWQPLWARDLPALRAIGANAIRTYSFWKFEPGFAAAPQNSAPTGVAAFWPQLDFTANATTTADRQFCVPGQPNIYAFEHRIHRDFLDALWNNGKNPIHVWIGVSLPPQLVDPATQPTDRAQYLQFYRYTARWLAKMYGNHPAVMGFVIGNELDTGVTTRTRLFWQTLNDIGQIVKASAPDKLTMSAFRDTPDFAATVTDIPGHPTGPQLYALDAWALNPYTNPASPRKSFRALPARRRGMPPRRSFILCQTAALRRIRRSRRHACQQREPFHRLVSVAMGRAEFRLAIQSAKSPLPCRQRTRPSARPRRQRRTGRNHR